MLDRILAIQRLRQTLRVTIVERGDDIPLQEIVQPYGVSGVVASVPLDCAQPTSGLYASAHQPSSNAG